VSKYGNIQVVVFDGRGVNPMLADWLGNFPHVERAGSTVGSVVPDTVASRRNRAIRWFLEYTELPDVLMLDDDMVPVRGTDALLESDADVAAARYIRKDGHEVHADDGEGGCGCMKISRNALERIEPPWFAFEFSDDGCEVKSCECGYFSSKARGAGFHPVKSGVIGHVVPVVVLPAESEGSSCRMKFLPEFRRGLPAPDGA